MATRTDIDQHADPIRDLLRNKWVAMPLALACFAGASLVGWHWAGTSWAVRKAELGGPGSFTGLDAGLASQLRAAAANPWLPVLGISLLAAGGLLGRVVGASKLARRLSVAAAVTLILLAALHVLECFLLGATVSAALNGQRPDFDALALQGAAFVGYALLPVAGLVALLGGVTTVNRLVVAAVDGVRRAREGGPRHHGVRVPVRSAARQVPSPDGRDAHWCDTAALPPGRTPGGLGVCLSGGGIRSATFGLGAIQALQEHPPLAPGQGRSELSRARYLTAVSGGAYAAGALLLATRQRDETGVRRKLRDSPHPASQPDAMLDLDEVFTPGSPELDHLRKHSSYIADSFREWAIAILVVIRGAFLSMLFLGLVALTAGRWAGLLYRQIGRTRDLASPWHPVWGPVFSTILVALLALLLWLTSTWTILPARVRNNLSDAAHMASVAVAALVLLGAVVPIITWASMAIINATGGAGLPKFGGTPVDGTPAGGATKGGILAVAGVIITIAGLLSRRRSEVIKAVRAQAGTWHRRIGDIGGQVVHWLCVYLGLALVAAIYLIIFGYSTWIAANAKPDGEMQIGWGTPRLKTPLTSFWLTVALTVLLLVVYLLVDETTTGLHPFYRRRLASAFAVRRAHASRLDPDHPSGFKAVAYEWQEPTDLETYGCPARRGKKLRPQVIFCAAAHCSDPEEAPPGRHVLPFTFSHDVVGGPEVGWCPTGDLRDRTSRRLRTDLTVQTAMAVSGAAFASASGTYRRPADVVLALMNARLGTWFPNPAVMRAGSGEPWWMARPPRIRRTAYLLREILGWYPKKIPLLFVTDGGLYENLGLLELLRHRCHEIYCFDATSDTETFAASLARSINLARDELGIEVIPAEPGLADPGASKNSAAAGDLRGRLATTPVITAEVIYPPREPHGTAVRGVLIVGRATLDADAPWEIKRHAAAHLTFPHDATGDQWFDDRKFNAYISLGRHVGLHAVKAMEQARARRVPRPSDSRSNRTEGQPAHLRITDSVADSPRGASA